MRVLHLLKTSVGASWALRQMRGLVESGIEVHAAMPPGPLVPAYRAIGVVVHDQQLALPVSRPHRWPQLLRDLRTLVDAVQPDLVHSHFVATTLTMRLALRRDPRPRIFQVPGPLHLEHAAIRRAELATATEADHWVGSCEWTCRAYRASGIPDARVHLNYYGIDLEEFTPRDVGRLRRELGFGPDVPVVGMVAYMYRPRRYLGQRRGIKGHEDLIDAMTIVRRSRPEVRCVMIGSAWDGAIEYERQVREYARERLGDAVVFLGRRTDVHELYSDIDVAVHPSHSENVGGAVESLLLGVPTVATNVGGFPDLVENGSTGWLTPPADPAALAATVLNALAHPAEARRLAAAGRERARAMFDSRRTGPGMGAIYRTILGRPL